jgi:hypothetical protein
MPRWGHFQVPRCISGDKEALSARGFKRAGKALGILDESLPQKAVRKRPRWFR